MTTTKRPGRWAWVKWLFILPIAIFLAVQAYFFVQIWWWVDHNPTMTAFMRQQQSAMREKDPNATIRQQWVPYERISKNLKRAIIASEDANFSEHDGVDWDALEKAFERNDKRGRITHGGSTITQQLAKNLFLSGSRSYVRKGQELIITYMLEALMDKQRIFEIYLNVVEFGRGIYGAEAAARYYYRIPAARLGAAQAAKLAVMLPNPRYYDAHRNTSYLKRRTGIILQRMGSAELP
ncbi:monofunctional biosynthetic peptidoglycan transglycosylase [Pseudoduganella plicata]|uniref:Biosynthetic peptidoglycan transglycosylase n=1 Tax=Pseudoduganella plicata TaxID=321984 RepID=A0A4P7BDT5_9BURK|nr:monofunctional biosynthetic peptidoglycan transglycosylase [Pseudoduganella plicata]QBQ36841.1 monofunctional biosynthetic peptidoglycan transglycosylase [Pseudoduganella plicata]GGY72274.1 monofunctional biosynthetic peptidoglycan transglycosylase [Pseudoduganella plicata]